MRIKDRVPAWPPHATPERGKEQVALLKDVVISAKRYSGAIECIILTLQNSNRSEYRVPLMISEHLIDKGVQLIEREPRITLHELGKLDI
jgi:hypothetical protein